MTITQQQLLKSSICAAFAFLFLLGEVFAQSPPGFSPAPGFYNNSVNVTLHAVPGDVIYYTLDGSEPDGNSKVFSGSIAVSDRKGEPAVLSYIDRITHTYATWAPPAGEVLLITVIRARVKRGDAWSKTSTATYIVNPDGLNRYSLPVLSIATDSLNLFDDDIGIYVTGTPYYNWRNTQNPVPNPEPGNAPANYFCREGIWYCGNDNWERPAHFEMFETDGNRVLAQDIGIRIHGGLSRALRGKSFRLYSRSDYGVSRFRYQIFPEQDQDNYNRLILRASGQDWPKTMFRDAFMQRLVSHLSFETQAYRPALLFLNGEFWGIYNIRERYDRHYFETHYGVEEGMLDYLTGNASVKEGSNALYNHLISYTSFDDAVVNQYDYIQRLMDTRNFIEYNVSNIYFNNRDWPHNNIDFWRYRTSYDPDGGVKDGRWRWMMFDTDFGFAWTDVHSEFRFNDHVSQNDLARASRENQWSTRLLRQLLKNPDFRNEFINTYRDLMNTAFQAEFVVSVINEMQAVIEPHMQDHLNRWGPLEHRFTPPKDLSDWDENVEFMRRFALGRDEHLIEHFTEMFNLGDLYTLRAAVDDTTMGYIRINKTDINYATPGTNNVQYPDFWEGLYFPGVPVTISAVSKDGYKFSHWLNSSSSDSVITFTGPSDGVTAVFEPVLTSITRSDDLLPEKTRLFNNYPNPFNPATNISFELHEQTRVRLEVYDITGRVIFVLADGITAPGIYDYQLNFDGLASGVYIARLSTSNQVFYQSMMYLK